MKFTITIPAYKRTFLKQAIDSCLGQTYSDYELIVVNDHSPEDLDSIIELYNDSRLRYYVNERNCGAKDVVDNWNKCLDYAKGEYIICMGDDDMLLPNCLQEYANLIDKYPHLDVYHGRSEIVDENGNLKELQESRPEWESAYSVLYHQCHCRRRQFIGDLLFRTSTLKKNGGFFKLDYGVHSDNITGLIAAKDKGVANTQHIIFQYREFGKTLSSNPRPRSLSKSIKAAYQWYDTFLKEKPVSDDDKKFHELIKKGSLRKSIADSILYCIMIDVKKNGRESVKYWNVNYKEYPLTDWEFFSTLDQLRYAKIRGYIDNLKKVYLKFLQC